MTNEIRFAPVYITNDLLVSNQMNGYLTQWIPQTYQLIPEGLVFYLASDQSFHDSPDPHLETRGLADGTVRFEKDDVINLEGVADAIPACSSIADVIWLCSISTSAPSLHSRRRSHSIPELATAREGLRKAKRNCASLSTEWRMGVARLHIHFLPA